MSADSDAMPYSDDIGKQVLARVMAGETVSSICKCGTMPDYPTLMGWLDAHPEFRDHYLEAHRNRAHALADEVLQVIRSGEFTASDKQVRIKGLMWAVNRSETRAGEGPATAPKGGCARHALPFGAHPADPHRQPRKSG